MIVGEILAKWHPNGRKKAMSQKLEIPCSMEITTADSSGWYYQDWWACNLVLTQCIGAAILDMQKASWQKKQLEEYCAQWAFEGAVNTYNKQAAKMKLHAWDDPCQYVLLEGGTEIFSSASTFRKDGPSSISMQMDTTLYMQFAVFWSVCASFCSK